MKTKIYFFILFLLAVGINVMQAQEWGYVSTLTGEEMRKICTQGLDTVYIVGENGLIARSIDQGETWEKQYFPTKTALNDIIFIDYYTGFAVGEQGTILKTTDAGETWEQRPIDATSNLNAIAATGLDNIWAVGDNGLILHSEDVGKTWETIDFGISQHLNDITFRGNEGYIVGNDRIFCKTDNAGADWDVREMPQPGIWRLYYENFLSVYQTANNIYVLNAYDAFLMDNNFDRSVLKINDTGIVDMPVDGVMSSFTFIDDDKGYGVSAYNVYEDSESREFSFITTPYQCNCWVFGCSYRIWDTNVHVDPEHSDVVLLNDSIGYAISGNVLMRANPKNTELSIEQVRNIKPADKPALFFDESKGYLHIKSSEEAMLETEIFSMFGVSVFKQKYVGKQMETDINLSFLPQGTYIIKLTLSDNKIFISKWIKQ